jgi:hypothetical protein
MSCGGPTVTGTYSITAVKCNGTAAASVIGTWLTSPNTLTITISTTAVTYTWANATCSITASATASFPSTSTLTTTPSGSYTCTGTSCTAFATSLFGTNKCSTSYNSAASTATVSPAGGVLAAAALTITAPSTDTTCSTAVAGTDPISFTGTKQ